MGFEKTKVKVNLTTEEGILGSYVNLTEPKMFMGKMRYDMAAILDPESDEYKEVKDIIEGVVTRSWGAGFVKQLYNGKLRSPLSAPDAVNPCFETQFPGMGVLSLNSDEQYPPQVVDTNMHPITSKEHCYSGCTFNLVFTIKSYQTDSGTKGVSAYINAAQVVTEGPPQDGRPDVNQEFKFIKKDGDEDAVDLSEEFSEV